MLKTYVITLTWNNSDDFADCVHSVLPMTISHDYTWVIVDNGSEKDELVRIASTFAWMRSMQGVLLAEAWLLKNDANLGIPVAQNQALDAIAECEGDDPYGVILLDADTTVRTGWMQELLNHAANHPDVGIVCGSKSPGSVACPVYHHPNGRWYVHDSAFAQGMQEGESVDFSCVYWRPELLARGLRFDEAYEIYDGYDQDLCFRVRSWGYRIEQIDAGVDHYASAAMKRRGYQWDQGGRQEWDVLRARNVKRFADLWAPFLAPYRDTIDKERAHMKAMNRKLIEQAGDRKAVPERVHR